MARARGWCFTINNYTDEDADFIGALYHDNDAKYSVGGREVGANGTPHIQGFVYFVNARNLGGMKALHPTAHWEPMRGTPKQASEYCKKDGDFLEFGELPLDAKERGGNMKQTIEERWELIRKRRFEELPPEQYFQYQKISLKFTVVKDRTVLDNLWIFGASGCGKSSWVRQNHKNLYTKAVNKWWDGYDQEPVVVVDDVDPNHNSKTQIGYNLKIWSDHYVFNAEVKGGMLKIRPQRVIVTSQYRIESVFAGEPETIDAINRRFHVVDMDSMATIGAHFNLAHYEEHRYSSDDGQKELRKLYPPVEEPEPLLTQGEENGI